MKKKTLQVVEFLDGLYDFIVGHPQFRTRTFGKSESHIQTEIRPLIVAYLERHFARRGYKDSVGKAHGAFYWEGQEGQYRGRRLPTFGARNYPDFIVSEPYLVAIEYKQSPNGALVKQGIGQCLMHTLGGDFDYAMLLFHDESPDKRIASAVEGVTERTIAQRLWADSNVRLRFV